MAKTKVSEWSAIPANNTDVGGIDINEGCAPSGINNAIRDVMAQIKDMQTGADGDNFVVGGNLTVNGTVTLATDLPVAQGGTGASTAADARTNLGLGSIATQASSSVTITGGSITGITDLAVADGGTGSSTLSANAVLLGNGTSALQTVAPSTSGNVLTSNGTTWTSAAPASPIGVGQTWQSVSRALNTTYTNSTGKPIQVSATINQPSGSGFAFIIDGVNVAGDSSLAGSSAIYGLIVPNGSTYRISATGGANIDVWAELR
jgi:hypothetical protein